MKKVFLYLAAIMLLSSPCFAGWQSDVMQNQNMATSYISALKSGQRASRPELIGGGGWQSQNARSEAESAMNQAEQLARAGRASSIQMPRFNTDIQERAETKREVRKELNARGYNY